MKFAPALGAVFAVVLSSCSSAPSHDTTISVLAASSLTAPFNDIGRQFEQNRSTKVTFDFAASSTLARQLADGENADVFASAALQDMQGLVSKHLVRAPTVFATNTLEIAVPKDNPKHVKSLADLGSSGPAITLCASTVPCGRLADAVLERAHVTVAKPSREDNVKAVLTKISLGEADAGIVYVSDIRSAPASVLGIPIPAAQNAITTYPIAVLQRSRHATTAEAFIQFVRSPAGRGTLRRYGFTVP